ncbi:MAG: glycosyltransferase family 2 protein [Limnoraphis sp. WC205]|jgi:glycosyltransferase involved in cell wall biosynthesis|nr:glycosyltransferase family 2 protein [Limnoraphis sp. WC205]
MRFSLILATLNRVQENERLFQSLAAQTHKNFQVIVADQNPDGRLSELINLYGQKFQIVHLKLTKKGLSSARNVGRLHIQGDLVAFPDDDSVYPPEILANVAKFFETEPTWDGVIARIYDLNTDQNAFEFCGGDDESQGVDYTKAYTVGISHAMFFRTPVVKQIAFDEMMGVGAGTPWGAAEDVDYLFQCLNAGYKFYYNAKLQVRHPSPLKKHNFREQIRREYSYGLGNGYLLGKHQLPQSLIQSALFSGYEHTLLEITKGNFRRASYFLMWGLG